MSQEIIVVCLAAAAANAADGSQLAAAPQAAQASTAAPVEPTYRLPLALAYAVPLSFQVATWVVPPLESGPYSGLGFASMLAAPFITHVVYENERGGLISIGGTLASLLGGAIAGATVFVMSGPDVCDDCDDGIGEVGSQIITGGAIGAGVGYLAWGIIDTALYARVPQSAEPASARVRGVYVVPPTLAVVTGADGTVQLSGLSLGVAGLF